MNWNDYKEHVKACSEDDRRNMEEIELIKTSFKWLFDK